MHSTKPEIIICKSLEEMYLKAAEMLVCLIAETLLTRELFSLVLSGGSTPMGLYSLLANDATFRGAIDWDKVHFFWGDERNVSPGHPDSNYRMAYEALLSKVAVPTDNIHRFKTELPDAQQAAAYYEKQLQQFFSLKPGGFPSFDCVLLGMGADGHTASLFPGTKALHERQRLVVANWVEKAHAHRLTLSVPVLNNSGLVIYLISGKDKAEALRQVLEGERLPEIFPAQLIKPTNGKLVWLVDKAAAAKLPPH